MKSIVINLVIIYYQFRQRRVCMMREYTLEILCQKYNISIDQLLKKHYGVLTQGEFADIDATLDYLINKLKVSRDSIEKCPSILYSNVGEIRVNFNILTDEHVKFSDIESCLHVLSSEHDQLNTTYNYVKNEYGLKALSNNTSVLSCSVELINKVESLKLLKEYNLTISTSIKFGSTNFDKIVEILSSKEYKDHPELFSTSVLARATKEDVKKLLYLPYWEDDKYKKLLKPSSVARSRSMVQKMLILIEMAENYCIDDYIKHGFLLKSPSRNQALIMYLSDNNMPLVVDGKLHPVFEKNPGALKEKYGIDLKKTMTKYSLNEKTDKDGKSK